MQQRPLGNTGLTVSALGFGCGAVGGLMVVGDPAEQRQAVARALDAGITYFDTAASYGNGRSEGNLGRVMGELGAWSQVVVGTKVRLRPEELVDPAAAIRASIETSLERLGRDDVDILHLHNPIVIDAAGSQGLSLTTVISTVAEGLQGTVQAGLARHAGFTGLGNSAAMHEVVRSEPFHSVQTYFNALNPSAGWAGRHDPGQQDFDGLIDTAAKAGRGVIVIRVLAAGAAAAVPQRAVNAGDPGGGLVSGGSYANDLARAQRLAMLAHDLGLEGPVELAIRFGLSKPGVSTVLVGYSTLAHLEDGIRFAERGPLPADAVDRVLALSAP
jgi:aryl-alcohol dehydrogenase-like predicted oxidoreductase